MKSVSEKEFVSFVKNYPEKLHVQTDFAADPPVIIYKTRRDEIVAKSYEWELAKRPKRKEDVDYEIKPR